MTWQSPPRARTLYWLEKPPYHWTKKALDRFVRACASCANAMTQWTTALERRER